MAKFKKGDVVRRTGKCVQDFKGIWINTGDTDVVSGTRDNSIFLEGHGDYAFSSEFFERVLETVPTGRKDDSGKLDMNLLDDMPRATKAIVEVMQWAITEKKPTPYDRGSWLGVHADRYRAAIKRHDRDACSQASKDGTPARFQPDSETGLLHLAHIACSAMMALENALREKEKA